MEEGTDTLALGNSSIQDAPPHAGIIEIQGMKGQPLPYRLSSDGYVNGLMILCLFLFAYAFSRNAKYALQRFRGLFQYRERSSLFDETQGAHGSYWVVYPVLTCILYGLCFYRYSLEVSPALVHLISSGLCIALYVAVVIFYVLLKLAIYGFTNWVFFDEKKNKIWVRHYFDLLAGQCFLLFPVALFLVYINSAFHITIILVLIIFIFAKLLLFYRSFRNFFSRNHGFLQFILYFCALEIVPLLLLIKGILFINQIVILNF